MNSQTINQKQRQAATPELPGIFKLAWMLFMQPVTLRHHLKACGIDDEPDESMPIWMLWWAKKNRTIKRRYALQMMTILLIATPVLSFILSLAVIDLFILLGYSINYVAWMKELARGVGVGVAFGVVISVAGGVVGGVAQGMAGGVAFGVMVGVAGGVAVSVAEGVARGVAVGVARSVVRSVLKGLAGDVAEPGDVLEGVMIGVVIGVVIGVSGGVSGGVSFIIMSFRFPSYLYEALKQIFLYMIQKALDISTLSSVPVLYHDLSYLPHPFLGSHILLNAEKAPALVRRVLKACKIAPGQRRAGQFALAHLQARELEKQIQQQQFGEILELKGQWLPGVEGADSSLLALREVARYLNSAEKSEIVHQRLQHLTQAETSLNSVKNQLLSDKSYLSHALRGTLPAWENVIRDLRQRAEKLAVNTLPNPFRAGDPLTQEFGKDVFKGRTDTARYIESLIADPSQRISLALLGPRRCGKTSLLNMLPEMLPDAVCVFFDLQGNPIDSPDSFFKALSQRAREQARRDRRLDLPPLPHGTPFESASQWLKQLDEIAGERRILICIDEFERLEDTFPGTRRELLQLMGLFRATIQHRRKVRLLISGVAAFDELDSLWSDHFINLREVRIGHLDHETSLDLLTQPVPEFPSDAVPLEFAEKVFERSGGLPYLLQLYGSILIQHLNSDKRKHADMSDFKIVEERVLEQGRYYFGNTVNSAPDSAKEILLALSRTSDTQRLDPQTRRWLQRRCLITEDEQLTIPVLGRWIREYGD